jgi:hypothetical protein
VFWAAWGKLREYAEMYAGRLITRNSMAEKKAALDARIKAAKEVLDEYEAKASQHVLTDKDTYGCVTEMKNQERSLQ